MNTCPQAEDRTIGADERNRVRVGAAGGCACVELMPESSAQAWHNLDLLYGGKRREPKP